MCIFVILCISLVQTVLMNEKYQTFYGSDIAFHSNLAAKYAAGENAYFSDYAIDENGGPYPPLFQLILAAGILLGKSAFYYLVKFFQYALYPGVMAATIYLVYRKMNVRAAAWTGIIMLASIALLDRTGQATPQGIDMILFPLAVLFFLEGKKWSYIILMTLMIYNHGIWAYLQFGALVLFTLIKKKTLKSLKNHIIVFVLSLPLFITTVYYLPGYFASHANFHSTQELLAAGSYWYLVKYMGLPIFLLAMGYFIYLIYNWVQKSKMPYRFSVLEQTSILWLLCLVPLLFMIKDRFVSYAMPPIAIILSGWIIREVKSRRVYIPLIILATIASMLFSLLAWIIYYQVNNQVFI